MVRRKQRTHKTPCRFGRFAAVLLFATAVLLAPACPAALSAAQPRGKAVLIIGAEFEDLRAPVEEDFNATAAVLQRSGLEVHRCYSPNAKWSQVCPVLQGANIVVYAGHGSGYDPQGPNPKYPYDPEKANGWTIDPDPSQPPDPESGPGSVSYHRQAGAIDRFVIQHDVAFPSNALVVMNHACYSAGPRSGEVCDSVDTIKKRVEDYSDTFLAKGANYFASNYFGSPQGFLSDILERGQTLEAARDAWAANVGVGENVYYTHPQAQGKSIKLSYSREGGPNTADSAAAGNMGVTASDILSGAQPTVGKTNYNEYLLVSNPGASDANVRVEFIKESGNSKTELALPSGGRYTLDVNSFANAEDVSLKVTSDVGVVAERAMYFDSRGRTDGSCAVGIDNLSGTWYFAEGYTGGAFDEWILLQNAEASTVIAVLTLMRSDGYSHDFAYYLDSNSRTTVHVDELPGFESCEVSARIEVMGGAGIAAERSMYFEYQGRGGSHVEHGVATPAREWHLAEGCTLEGPGMSLDTYVLIENPGDTGAEIHVDFLKDGGGIVPLDIDVAAHSRRTIVVDGVEGMGSSSFSTRVTSSEDIIVERSMYFDYLGLDGGSCAAGISEARRDFYFAEGCTAQGFDTFLCIANPNDSPVEVKATFIPEPSKGGPFERSYPVAARSRFTLKVDDVYPEGSLGMKVHCENPVMAERAMYFNYGNSPAGNPITGGHAACGAVGASTAWYFAEGYTGW